MPRPKGWSKFAGKQYRRDTEGRIKTQAETILRLHGQVKREKDALEEAKTELRMREIRVEAGDQALQEMQEDMDEAKTVAARSEIVRGEMELELSRCKEDLQDLKKYKDGLEVVIDMQEADLKAAEQEMADLRSRVADLESEQEKLALQLKMEKENCEVLRKKLQEAEKERGYAETAELDMRKFWLRYYDRMTSLVEEIGEDMANAKLFE